MRAARHRPRTFCLLASHIINDVTETLVSMGTHALIILNLHNDILPFTHGSEDRTQIQIPVCSLGEKKMDKDLHVYWRLNAPLPKNYNRQKQFILTVCLVRAQAEAFIITLWVGSCTIIESVLVLIGIFRFMFKP